MMERDRDNELQSDKFRVKLNSTAGHQLSLAYTGEETMVRYFRC